MNCVVEFEGKLYKNWWSLFYELERDKKIPEGINTDDDYSLEKFIITEVMKLDAKERPIK